MRTLGIVGASDKIIPPDGDVAPNSARKRARLAEPVGCGPGQDEEKDDCDPFAEEGCDDPNTPQVKKDAKEELCGDENEAGADSVATGYWKLSGHSVTQLQRYCTHLSPAILSLPNLRQMAQRGRECESRICLLEMIEAGTGLSPDCSPRNELRNMDSLLRYMAHRHVMRGRRLNNLSPLPRSWEERGGGGIYGFEVKADGTVTLMHVRLGLEKDLPPKQAELVKDKTTLRIGANFSESGATSCETSAKGINYKLMCSFPDQVLLEYMDGDGDAIDGTTGGTPTTQAPKGDTVVKEERHSAPAAPAASSQPVATVPNRRCTFKKQPPLGGDLDEHGVAPPPPKFVA